MSPVYDYPTNVSTLEGLVTYGNDVTSNGLGMGILFVVWVVLFFSLKSYYSTERCFAGSSFIAFLISVFAFALSFIPDYIMYFFLAMTIMSVFFLLKKE